MAKLMSGGNVPRIALWIISEFKLNDHLKIDGRRVDVLLLGLRNDLLPPPELIDCQGLTNKALAIFFL